MGDKLSAIAQYAVRRLRSSPLPSPFSPLPSPLSPLSSPARRGVSLLEVLVSMFIILFGLLGVAALLEVGRSEMGSATRLDRAMTCGRSALAEVKIRGMADPNRWVARYDTNTPYTNWSGGSVTPQWAAVSAMENSLQHYQAYVIDPLYITQFLTDNPGANDQQITDNTARFPYTSGAPLFMGRCSLDAVPTAALFPYFDRMFVWPDDQVFNIPRDPAERPTRQVDAAGIGQFEGNYSWMVTVCPVPTEVGQTVADRSLYEVSAVVFHQRDFSSPLAAYDPDRPGERVVTVEVTGGGYGGGDVRLSVDSSGANARTATYLDVRENEWILLCGTSAPQNIFKWYRVVSAGEVFNDTTVNPNQWRRLVTLAGPDWGYGNGYGVLCTGVAGVYTEVMAVNR